MGQLATDTFTRADSGTLGANWTTLAQWSNLGITSNQCKASVSTPDCVGAYTGAGAIALNMYAQCLLATVALDGGPCVRMNPTSNDLYLLDTGPTTCDIYKHVAGTWVLLSTVSTTWASNDVAYLEVQGTTIVSKQNGTLRNSLTDTAIDGSTVGGPYAGLYGGGATIVFDTFEVGNFVSLLRQMFQQAGA